MTLTLTFAPTNQTILTWATLYFAILHHCIGSVLSYSQNTHFIQGPKSDYTHAYNNSMLNLLSCQLPFWSLSVFSLLNFLVFILAQLPLVYQWHTIWILTKIWLSSQRTLHRLKLSFLFVVLMLLWSWIGLLVWLSLIGTWYLTATPTPCSFMPVRFYSTLNITN